MGLYEEGKKRWKRLFRIEGLVSRGLFKAVCRDCIGVCRMLCLWRDCMGINAFEGAYMDYRVYNTFQR